MIGISAVHDNLKSRTVDFAGRKLDSYRGQGLVSAEGSVSSVSVSDSDSGDDGDSHRRHRLKYTFPPRLQVADTSMLRIVPHKTNPDKSLVVVAKFLKRQKIEQLVRLFRESETVYEVKDRKEDLYHAHSAFRVEIALRLGHEKTYKRIMETTVRVCDAVWGDIREKKIRRNRVLPEFEYIVYDLPSEDSQGSFIEPHVDNHSVVTGIVMLSAPDIDFVGGVNRFKGSDGSSDFPEFREVKLQQGDLVLFRGEIVTHWITPVTSGRREILQWELSRI